MASVQLAYQIVTDRITKLLEEGTCPWQRPWSKASGLPKNLFSQREYRGINVWMLGAQSYASPFWATFNQVRTAGGNVRKGEKSTPIVFWKVGVGEDDEGRVRKSFLLRYYNVWNSAQIESIAIPQVGEDPVYAHTPLEQCEKLVGNYPTPPTITYGSNQAFYRPSTDSVHMPAMHSFRETAALYSTLFHELGHSTGHKDRLNRATLVDAVAFGTVKYAREELVAEMTAAYLCGVCGIDNTTVNNSAAYLKGWLKCLQDDPKMLVQAAGQAQKAADYIQGLHLDTQGD